MKTSTLRKLPIPFMAVCGLGIGLVGFLMIQPKDEPTASQAVAQQETDAQATRRRPATNRYRAGNPVAKLNRPGGNDYRPVKKSGAQVAHDSSSDAKVIATGAFTPELKPAEVAAKKNTARKAAETAAKQSASKQVAASDTSPLRRDADAVKTTTVAATRPEGRYSAKNPDPSELLSKVLESNTLDAAEDTVLVEPVGTTAQSDAAIDVPGSIVMPPVLDMEGPALATPENEGSARKDQPAPAPTRTAAVSVVAGELKLEGDSATTKIVIRNPKENKLPVWFVANQHKVELKPGQKFVYPANDDLEVRFARGGELGADKVVMKDGDWNFSVTRQTGWKLTQFN